MTTVSYDLEPRTASSQTRQVLSVQAWKSKKIIQTAESTALKEIESKFAQALNTESSETRTALAATPMQERTASGQTPYAFHDVIDIVNPLHHLPIVGTLYRKFSGDTIKPMSQVLGGAVFGGPVGAIGGTVSAVIQIQKGTEPLTALLSFRAENDEKIPAALKNNPEDTLNFVADSFGQENGISDFPQTALPFISIPKATKLYEKTATFYNKEHFAGILQNNNPVPFIKTIDLEKALPKKETITTLSISELPSVPTF